MLNKRIEVFGRIKPASKNSQIKDYIIEEGINEDTLKFANGKYSSAKHIFRFKKIFRSDVISQDEVFENAAKPIIENVLTGYNGTIFAYGQTGTGKTYTMTGDFTVYKERGIIPRTIQFIFHSLKDTSTVKISYFEIYNEHGYDLIGFQPTANAVELQQVNVLEDSKGNLHFRNLSIHNVRSVEEALDLLLFGDGNRMAAETMNNLRSSRSHTIFLVTLDTSDPANDSSIRSTLHLVDLAGSERLGKTGNILNNSWESRYINLSLHYLEQVLVALGEPNRIHVPYRNSLMTTVLKNSLGGNGCTSMIANFSCELKDFEETLQTCRFSQRVALVRNEAKINEFTDIDKELIMLRRENAYLKEKLRELHSLQTSDYNPGRELLDEDKNECYNRVKDFIAGSHFVNLPLTDCKKAQYCFMLMRNEILKLRPMTKFIQIPNEYPLKSFAVSRTAGYVNQDKFGTSTFLESVKNDRALKWKTRSVLKKRRVAMDIPKINVIYKKCKSTESIPNLGSESKLEDRDNWPSGIENENKTHLSKVSHSSQNSSISVNLRRNIEIGCLSSEMNAMEDIEKQNLITEKSTLNERIKFGEIFSEWKSESHRKGRVYGGNCMPVKNTNKAADPEEEFADNEEEDDDILELDEEMKMSLGNAAQSNRSSQFSLTGLPLTGDTEIDEEIIKFYKARFRKFKSKDWTINEKIFSGR